MSRVNSELAVTLPVAADYSSTGQYRFVNVNSSSQAVLVSAAGAAAIGVLSDNPGAAGRPGRVVWGGITKVIAGATVAAGAKVQADANGAAITAATGDHVQGTCITGGDAGEVLEVLLLSQHILA